MKIARGGGCVVLSVTRRNNYIPGTWQVIPGTVKNTGWLSFATQLREAPSGQHARAPVVLAVATDVQYSASAVAMGAVG